jgi:hypothetical protein
MSAKILANKQASQQPEEADKVKRFKRAAKEESSSSGDSI